MIKDKRQIVNVTFPSKQTIVYFHFVLKEFVSNIMPKATKLHSKGKPNSIQKHHKVEEAPGAVDPEESMRQFQLELCWCIQQLERTLNEKKGSEKQCKFR